jgi:K+-transporting ATPase ATPase C chain
LYPALLLVVGQTLFAERAQGSMLLDRDRRPTGSRLIAQPFTQDRYFWPRPSAVTYNASASGATNWGAASYLLRDRVARQLGPLVKYRSGSEAGKPVGPDLVRWFQEQPPDFVARWAAAHAGVAEQWVKDNAEAVAYWQGRDADAVKADSAEAGKAFFGDFTRRHPGAWPGIEEVKNPDGQAGKRIKPVRDGTEIQAYLFDAWLQAHPDADFEPVPADMVMASGSGLDPHITLANARYQLDRVAEAWALKTGLSASRVRQDIEEVLQQKSEAPLGGLVGVDLINVLETNLALQERYEPVVKTKR